LPSRLANSHVLAQERLRRLTKQAVAAIWASLPGYNERDVEPWLAAVLPVILGAQHRSVVLTDGYLARRMNRLPLAIPPDTIIAKVRGDTSPEEVYRRPFAEVPWEDAVAQGLDRAESAAVTDVQMAMRQTAADVGARDDGIVGYERVLDGDACDLCQIASTQRYHSEDLLPIHNNCGCSVEPIVGEDVGQVINPQLLRELKQQGALTKVTQQRQRARAREKATKVAVREHGELGPTLTDAADNFTGPSDL
jgi:hypothetical protein